MDRFKPTKYDKIQDDETAEAVEKAHTQNTDTKLDEGGASEVIVADIKDAVDKKHTQDTDQKLDEGGANEVTAIDAKDAIDKKHVQNTDTDLDPTFEGTFVKKVDNVNVLADITSLGANIEDAVTHKDLTNNPHAVSSAQVGAYTQAEVNALDNKAKCIEITLSGNANNYLFAKSATYAVLSRFVFKGTTILGSPTNIKAIIHVKTAAKPGDVRIYDLTNANVICEVTGVSSLVPITVNLGTLSNLPSGEAMFEVQAKDPLADEIYVSGIVMEF